MGTTANWYQNAFAQAKKKGGAQTYMNTKQQKTLLYKGNKPSVTLLANRVNPNAGIVGNNPGQIKPAGASYSTAVNNLNTGYNTAVGNTKSNYEKALAAVANRQSNVPAYTPGTYTPGAAPDLTFTPAERATYEQMLERSNGILAGQKQNELVGYNNQINALNTKLQSIVNSYNTQYKNDEADMNRQLDRDMKANLESGNARGMFWSTIPDIQAKDLQTEELYNLGKLKEVVNANIANATSQNQTDVAGVEALKAALDGKYGSAAQEMAYNLLNTDNATKDAADARALQLVQMKSDNYNQSENRNANIFTSMEGIKAGNYNSALDRESNEKMAEQNRITTAEQAELDRLQRKYETDQNSLTEMERQRLADLQEKANRDLTASEGAKNRAADKANTDAKIKADAAQAAASNKTQIEVANIYANKSGGGTGSNGEKTLTPQQQMEWESYSKSVLNKMMGDWNTTLGGLKEPTTDAKWQQWQNAYDTFMQQINSGTENFIQAGANAAFKNSPFFKQYNAYLKQRGGGKAPATGGKPSQSKPTGTPSKPTPAKPGNASVGYKTNAGGNINGAAKGFGTALGQLSAAIGASGAFAPPTKPSAKKPATKKPAAKKPSGGKTPISKK